MKPIAEMDKTVVVDKEEYNQLQTENEILREITNIKDPEQHFEQIMTANKQLQSENESFVEDARHFSKKYADEYNENKKLTSLLSELWGFTGRDKYYVNSELKQQIEQALKGKGE